MSVPAPGLEPLAASNAEDPHKEDLTQDLFPTNAAQKPSSTDTNGALADDIPEDERHVAPDQFDPAYETTRYEIWAYYCYYIGNNGLSLFNFAPTAFQNLLYQAAGDAGVLRFLGK
jgi:hypothetical protein